MKKILYSFISISLLLQLLACSGSGLKKDESIIIFPTSANQMKDGSWKLPIHHWVFEKEDKDFSRKITQKVFSEVFESLGVSDEESKTPLVRERVSWFLVDNQRQKEVILSVAEKSVKLAKTKANGHAISLLSISGDNRKAGDWVGVKVEDEFNRDYSGEVQLIPKMGLSVISDIDDTIKDSHVLEKKELIKNTFVKPFKTTHGFPEYYKKLRKQGAFFHYISASPWQLYPSLKPFMADNYPKGTFSFRNFRLKDSSFIKFLQSSADYKITQISKIIKRYPEHQFILIGDSGEHDPEVYAKIYSQFPNKIKSIKIRAVKGSDLSDKRFAETFKGMPKSIWEILTELN